MTKESILSVINKFSKQLSRPSDKGSCLDVSNRFWEFVYKELGHNLVSIQFGWLGNEDHCWVEIWADDMPLTLVDFTADQFGSHYPELIIGEVKEIFKKFPYKYDDR